MFFAHTAPRVGDAELLADGRSSILFATLAGVSLGLMTGGATPSARGSRLPRVNSIVVRALLLFLLGVVLSTLDSGIAIILDYYAIMFLLLLPLLFAPRWLVAAVVVLVAALVPGLASAVALGADSGSPLYLVQYYLLVGYYPALLWVAFLGAGLLAARCGLGLARTQLVLVGLGALLAVLGYGAAAVIPGIDAEAHSGSIAEVAGSGGTALAVIGLLCWLSAPERGGLGRAVRRLLHPLAAAGSMALSVYTTQIVVLAIAAAVLGGSTEYDGWALLITMSAASLLAAVLWRRYLGRGPLERLFALLTRPSDERGTRRAR